MGDYRQNAEVYRLEVTTPTAAYPIIIGTGLLTHADKYLEQTPKIRNLADVLIISNDTVYPLYGEALKAQLVNSGRNVYEYIIPDGEVYKTWDTAEKILSFALKHQLSRKTLIIALGGGVVGDLAGFAASIYLREYRWYRFLLPCWPKLTAVLAVKQR